ncbi:MAG: hypothetical protein OXF44_07425 [Anaerolineaceae bacterium]|nr:hypothetical protein [Anaerolineaceae bacterium]
MDASATAPVTDQRLVLCTLMLVFAVGHIIIGMIRGARSWRSVGLILLALAVLALLLATLGRSAAAHTP